jgi:uncharacterized protein YneF (UPF0154 family)
VRGKFVVGKVRGIQSAILMITAFLIGGIDLGIYLNEKSLEG